MRVSNVIPFDPGQASLINVEAEFALLGAILIDNAVLGKLAAQNIHLKPHHFYEPLHGRIFERITAMADKDIVASATLIRPYFENDAALGELGGVTYIARMIADGRALLAPGAFAEQIVSLAGARAAKEALSVALSGGQTDRGEMLRLFKEVLYPDGDAAIDTSPTFPLLSIAEIIAMPPPEWLVRQIIAEDSLTVIYGDPGSGKSFLAVDMALRIASGVSWHGLPTRRTGVLYIAGEGTRGIGKRVDGWYRMHRQDYAGVPFMLLPVAVQLMDPAERAKLLRTIDEAKRRIDFDIGLTVIDTVSRAMAGQDENTQETMSAFVRACDEVKRHTGGAAIGIHHSGKDKDRGMRGSSVLLGACDGVLKLAKDEDGAVTLTCEKQKDDEEFAPIFFEFDKYTWNTGSPDEPGADLSTLVPVRRDRNADDAISRDKIARAFGMMTDAWADGKPLSHKPQSRDSGRFAPAVFALKIGGEAAEWKGLIDSWLINGAIVFEMVNTDTKVKGLKVLEPIF